VDLLAGDRIVDVDGVAATARVLNDAINAKSPGATIRLRVSRAGKDFDVTVDVAANVKRTYRFEPDEASHARSKARFSPRGCERTLRPVR
jgi:C-terminal processing protease CtpA/Prc